MTTIVFIATLIFLLLVVVVQLCRLYEVQNLTRVTCKKQILTLQLFLMVRVFNDKTSVSLTDFIVVSMPINLYTRQKKIRVI